MKNYTLMSAPVFDGMYTSKATPQKSPSLLPPAKPVYSEEVERFVAELLPTYYLRCHNRNILPCIHPDLIYASMVVYGVRVVTRRGGLRTIAIATARRCLLERLREEESEQWRQEIENPEMCLESAWNTGVQKMGSSFAPLSVKHDFTEQPYTKFLDYIVMDLMRIGAMFEAKDERLDGTIEELNRDIRQLQTYGSQAALAIREKVDSVLPGLLDRSSMLTPETVASRFLSLVDEVKRGGETHRWTRTASHAPTTVVAPVVARVPITTPALVPITIAAPSPTTVAGPDQTSV